MRRFLSDVCGNIQRKAGLADAGACADDDKIAFAHSDKVFIDIGKIGRRAERVGTVLFERFQVMIQLNDNVADMRKPFSLVFFGDIEDKLFRAVKDILGFALGGIRHFAYFVRRLDQTAKHGLILDNAHVIHEVIYIRHGFGKRSDIGFSAGFIQCAACD